MNHSREGFLQAVIFSGIILYLANSIGFFDIDRLTRGVSNLFIFAADLFPPDLSVTETLLYSILETIQMALMGTILGFIAALPLGLLGARNISGRNISAVTRLFLGGIRTIPALLWAIIFVVAFGLGPLPGTLGLAIYSVGYLSKLYYEAFEAVDQEILDAVRAIGISRLKEIRFVVLPESMNHILSQLFFMFEYNVRSSAILGFVGAGGIGFYMINYIQLFQYQRLTTAVLLTLAVVLIIDSVSARIRDRFLTRSSY
ncbi:phosphonate ABC transporter, permease protein PhnE [Candidatus Methanoperedens nitroreducens]|uniref:Phosphonate ABC transporter, permease protein PhnE n=1 Tax=Candidatus Methanoperedens nitratireducens TaxID=1392998 RepID=A0A062V632_9EURY|nr:phosphonate ABC transporter, permease protein PhnE [Candidatus Methanoperedens nitroreducens]KCZ70850.1 phosphonate ABC transporter, permease protein PhnE [Candidatus Methanoperedens nitroreducens]MDJ1420705.1 phosphonate ABC transporter, permease protein PhnE [Candidatus Methanoperedens sp.]